VGDEVMNKGNCEGGCLSGTGIRDAHNVFSVKHELDCLILNRGRGDISFFKKIVDNPLLNLEILKLILRNVYFLLDFLGLAYEARGIDILFNPSAASILDLCGF
jgi:hypothetical protein